MTVQAKLDELNTNLEQISSQMDELKDEHGGEDGLLFEVIENDKIKKGDIQRRIKVIDRLSADLREAFPDMKGLSSSNLKYMRFFAQECPDRTIGQQSADQLPWFHIVILITKISDPVVREFYAREAIVQSWPREMLEQHIRTQLHLCQGAAVTNFRKRLEPAHADRAHALLKDPYRLDTCLPSIEELESHLSLELEQTKEGR